MKNPNLSKKNMADYHFAKGFPTRENCDLNDPKEMFLWCFAALPGLNGGHFAYPIDYYMMVSEHLWELGLRLTAEPLKKYRPPTSNDPNWMTSPGNWVPLETPDPEPNPAKRVFETLTQQQKAEILNVAMEAAGLTMKDVEPNDPA